MSDAVAPPHPTVLVVVDAPQLWQMLTPVLEAEGYASETAADGPAAVARLARGGIDLVLLDLMLPGMDGRAVCREVRAQTPPGEPYLPIIMLTALTRVADQQDGFA